MACLVLKEKNKIKQRDGNPEIMPLPMLGYCFNIRFSTYIYSF